MDLYANFWIVLDPLIKETGYEYPLSKKTAVNKILNESIFVFSGMLYGFEFRYTPSNRARKIEEIFILTPICRIPFGDPKLQVVQTWKENECLYARIRYRADSKQSLYLKAWKSNIIPVSSGLGMESILSDDIEGKATAVKNGIKAAIREYLKKMNSNKPKEIRGSVQLSDPPYIIIDQGMYKAKVKIKLKIYEINKHRIY